MSAKIRAEKLAELESAAPSEDGLSYEARRWLAVGEQGLSSCALFWRLTGVKPPYIKDRDHYFYPHDPSDLRRCMLLLDQVPELQGRVSTDMRGISPEWDALAAQWEPLCACMAEEIPNWRQPRPDDMAPKTYDLMKSILKMAR